MDIARCKNYIDYAVILAGGMGKRAVSITSDKYPKCLISINNIPIINYIISYFKSYKVSNIIISTSHHHDKVKKHVSSLESGSSISYVIDKPPLGVTGALKYCAVKMGIEQPFFMINGDTLTNVNLFEMQSCYHAFKEVLMSAVPCPDYRNNRILKIDPECRIVKSILYPKQSETIGFAKHGKHFLVNSGLYIIDPKTLNLIQDDSAYSMSDYIQELIDLQKIYAFISDGQYFNVGTTKELQRASKEWKPDKKTKRIYCFDIK